MSLQNYNCVSKNPEGQRRLQAAHERINRSLAEQIEEQDQVPPVHGGDEIDGQVAPEFKFEDLDVSKRRVDVDESL